MEEYWYRRGKIFSRLAFYTWVVGTDEHTDIKANMTQTLFPAYLLTDNRILILGNLMISSQIQFSHTQPIIKIVKYENTKLGC